MRLRPLPLTFALLASAAHLVAEEPFATLFPRGYPSGLLLEDGAASPAALSLSPLSAGAFSRQDLGVTPPGSPPEIRNVGTADASVPRESSLEAPAKRRGFDTKTVLATSGMLLSVASASYAKWWSGTSTSFHFRSEGFFGQGTYAGGLDKISHFFFSNMFFGPVDRFYRVLDHSPVESSGLAMGTVIGMGAVVEAGDGFGTGASWEDLAADAAGAVTAYLLRRTRLDDTVGFRLGWVPTKGIAGVYQPGPFDEDYSQEIYSADLKLNGLFRRLSLSPGVARFLLLSVTYDTKGYGQSTVPAQSRERNVGVAVGLNLAEVARALGVREDTWWSTPLYGFLTSFRIPYTAFGFRYDLNHRRWQGPDTGDRYHPGRAP